MAYTDHSPKRIKPEDLRVECRACGGDGRIFDVNNSRPNIAVRSLAGPCQACTGTGKLYPRRKDHH